MRMAVVNSILASPMVPFRLRTLLFRILGLKVPLRSKVSSGVFIRTPNFGLGVGSTLNVGVVLENQGGIQIGSHVGIAIGVRIITVAHDMSDPDRRAGEHTVKGVTIDDGAWIGSGATILPGVTVGKGAVVAAGAVVTRDCDPNTLYAGVPARAIRALEV